MQGGLDALEEAGPVAAILQNLSLFQRDEPALHHAVEDRQKALDLLLGVDDLDEHRQARTGIDAQFRTDEPRMAEALRTRQYGRAGHLHREGARHDRLVEAAALAAILLTDEHAEKHRLGRRLHRLSSSIR